MRLLSCLLLVAASLSSGTTLAAEFDTAIVFAVDVSASVDTATAVLQRDGHAVALSEPSIIATISAGRHGCIAVSYVEWSSRGKAQTIVPWTAVCNRPQALTVSVLIRLRGSSGHSCSSHCATSISDAIAAGSALLERFADRTASKVIDISASGTNNDGFPLESVRARALEKGYTINAIAVPQVRFGVAYRLLGYFRENVIGGVGSFAIEPSAARDYTAALRQKLGREISQAAGPVPYGIAAKSPTVVQSALGSRRMVNSIRSPSSGRQLSTSVQ